MAADRDTERKRRFTHKTRSGCVTCKSRHVKCDEGKPGCAICWRAGYRCGGYAVPRQWLFEARSSQNPASSFSKDYRTSTSLDSTDDSRRKDCLHQLQRRQSGDGRSNSNPAVAVYFGTAEEQRALDYFVTKSAPALSMFETRKLLWTILAPRLSWLSPAVKYLMVAVSLLDEHLTTITDNSCLTGPDSQTGGYAVPARALAYYTRGIRCLATSSQPTPTMTTPCIIIACALAWMFELYQNNVEAADMHLLHGSQIAQQWRLQSAGTQSRSEQDYILDIIQPNLLTLPGVDLGVPPLSKHAEVQAEAEAVTPPPLPPPLPTYVTVATVTDETEFQTLQQALDLLCACVDKLMHHRIPALQARQFLASWQIGYDRYTAMNTPSPLLLKTVIQLVYITALTLLHVDGGTKAVPGAEVIFWSYIMRRAESMVENAKGHLGLVRSSLYQVLTVVRSRCLDDGFRRKADRIMVALYSRPVDSSGGGGGGGVEAGV